ncbi:MAG: hypothetical protein O3A51_02415 [Verrucomicrobia bacterium]|nr:hypothetical protein [Verrucomicrobiota bacterium]
MAEGVLHIGWARGDITPEGRALLQGQFHARLAEGTLSPLTATALAMEVCAADGTTEQVVFLSCDVANDDFKADLLQLLAGRCDDLDLRKLTVSCTHTHTAPVMRHGCYDEPEDVADFIGPDAYRIWLAAGLADIVEQAWRNRQAGTLSRGFGYAVVGRCRRAVYADGSAMMYGDTARPDFSGFEACDDHAVNMLFARTPEGDLTGILVNLACPSQCDEQLYQYSADFWHNVREAIAERFGAAVHLLPQCAPAGDLSPHLMMDQKEECDLRNRMGVDDKGIISHRIMAAITEGLASASPAESTIALVHDVHTFSLPRRMVTDAEYELEKRLPAMSETERNEQPFGFQRIWRFSLCSQLEQRYEQQQQNPNQDVECHIIRLGDAVFATNPFELFVDYGTRIRCRSQALQTFLIQLADGSALGCYLATQRAIEGGHYSAMIKSCWVSPEGGQQLVDETVRGISKLFAGQDYPRTR